MKPLHILAAACSLAFLVPIVAAPTAPVAQAQNDTYWDAKLVPGVAPYALVGTTLDDKKVSLDDYKGKVVLIDFWATWCGPCVAEMPNALAQYKKYHGKGFEILGISRDHKQEALTKFIADHKVPWAQVYDRDLGDESNAAHYGVTAIPFFLLIGKDGKIAAVNPRGEELEPAIKEALAK